MTDSILRSYQWYSYTTVVPYPLPVTGADYVLAGEADGFAIDATASPGTVSVLDTGTPANDLSNVEYIDSPLSQAGTSPKMVHHASSPYVRWANHNLIRQSQSYATTWTQSFITITSDAATAPDGTVTADNSFNVNISASLRQDLTILANTVYTFSAYAKYVDNRWMLLQVSDTGSTDRFRGWFDILNGVLGTSATTGAGVFLDYGMEDAGNGWYRCWVTGYISLTAGRVTQLQVNADGATQSTNLGNAYYWGSQLVRGYETLDYMVTTTAARYAIAQSYDVAATQYGIWSEPAATDLCLWSDDFTNAVWTATGTTSVTANATSSPEAQTTADTILLDSANSEHDVYQAVTMTASTIYTFSCYVKKVDHDFVQLAVRDATANTNWYTAVFNLSTGAVGQSTAGAGGTLTASAIHAVGDWYRISVSGSISPTANRVVLGLVPTGTGNTFGSGGAVTWTAAGQSLYVWGAQMELGPIATSNIPTAAISVTRAADVISIAESAIPGSDSASTIYLDYKPLRVDSGTRYGWAYWKDSSNFYSYAGVTANPTMGNTNAGSSQYAVDLGTLVAGTRAQITIGTAPNDADGSQNGVAPTAQGTVTLTTAYTTLYLGTFGTTGSELNGYIYRVLQVPYQRETINSDIETWRYNF